MYLFSRIFKYYPIPILLFFYTGFTLAAPSYERISFDKHRAEDSVIETSLNIRSYHEAIFPYVNPFDTLPVEFRTLLFDPSQPDISVCPTAPSRTSAGVAGASSNMSFSCSRTNSHLLPFFKINNQLFNNRSLPGNYTVTGYSLTIHTVSEEMNGDCMNCMRINESSFTPRIDPNMSLTVIECPSTQPYCNPPAYPFSNGKPTLIDFHKSGLNNNNFEFFFRSNIQGCENTAAIEVMADMCGPDTWSRDFNYTLASDKLTVPKANPVAQTAKRYTAVLRKNPDGDGRTDESRICAREHMLNTIAPNITSQNHTVSEGQEVCLDIPASPRATQYILATAAHPDGQCSCNFTAQNYLTICSCQIGSPRLNLSNTTGQICFTNRNGSLNDAVIFMTRDSDSYYDSRVCEEERRGNNADFYSHNLPSHSLFLSEHRINAVNH